MKTDIDIRNIKMYNILNKTARRRRRAQSPARKEQKMKRTVVFILLLTLLMPLLFSCGNEPAQEESSVPEAAESSEPEKV